MDDETLEELIQRSDRIVEEGARRDPSEEIKEEKLEEDRSRPVIRRGSGAI